MIILITKLKYSDERITVPGLEWRRLTVVYFPMTDQG
jgi:hypothetical protein